MHWIYLNELWKDFPKLFSFWWRNKYLKELVLCSNHPNQLGLVLQWMECSCSRRFHRWVNHGRFVAWVPWPWKSFLYGPRRTVRRSGQILTFGSSWSFHRACLPTSWFHLVRRHHVWRSFLWWFVKSSIACKLIRSSSSGACIRTRHFPSMSYPTSMDRRKVDRSSWSSCNEVHPTWSFHLLKLPFVVFWWWSFCFHHWSWSYPKLKSESGNCGRAGGN